MKALTVTAQPKPEPGWVHRFRNFGEEVYVELRTSCEVNIAEIDAAFDQFHVGQITNEEETVVARAVAALNCAHHLDDSVFISTADSPVFHQTVGLVLDTTLGERLSEIAGRHPIWVVGSKVNRAAVEELRVAHANGEIDVTLWSNTFKLVTEEDWLSVLNTVNMNHGVFASNPPMNKLTIYGSTSTHPAVAALRQYGFEAVLPTASGFIALQEWRGLTSR